MQRILIVEDSKMVQQILRHLTSQQINIPVDFAWSLREAASLIKKNKYTLSLVDLTLPDAPNGEVVKLTLKMSIPTVVLTSTMDEYKRQQMLEMGVVDYVLKDNRDSYLYAIQLLAQLLSNQGSKALIADDSVTSRSMMKKMLKQMLFEVIEAENGEQALIMLKQDPSINLLLTDFAMPIKDGFELVKEIRNTRGRDVLGIIGISGAGSQSLSAKFIKNGANDFLTKPFLHEEFHCRVMHTMEQLKLIAKIKDAANKDYLTDLYNRRYFYNNAESSITALEKQQRSIVVAMLDIDYFKPINDSYGHQAGDAILVQLSVQLKEYFSDAMVARVGGEEFALFLTDIDHEKAYEMLDEFRFQVANSTFKHDGQPMSVTISAGIVARDSESLQELIKHADAALYDAKGNGRNQVVSYHG